MDATRRLIGAYKEGRLSSAILQRFTRVPDFVLQFCSGLPKSTKPDIPTIVTSGSFRGREGPALKGALQAALENRSKLPQSVRDIEGMSGQRYRTLINTLIQELGQCRYLEVGSWRGSTAASALYGNDVDAVCIDNWSQFSGTKESFLENMAFVESDKNSVRLIESDFREVDYSVLGTFQVYLFDGPHSEKDQRDALTIAKPCLAERFVFVVDDWNLWGVRRGTMLGLVAARLRVEASIQVRSTNNGSHPSPEESDGWHNGYLIAVVRKI